MHCTWLHGWQKGWGYVSAAPPYFRGAPKNINFCNRNVFLSVSQLAPPTSTTLHNWIFSMLDCVCYHRRWSANHRTVINVPSTIYIQWMAMSGTWHWLVDSKASPWMRNSKWRLIFSCLHTNVCRTIVYFNFRFPLIFSLINLVPQFFCKSCKIYSCDKWGT